MIKSVEDVKASLWYSSQLNKYKGIQYLNKPRFLFLYNSDWFWKCLASR